MNITQKITTLIRAHYEHDEARFRETSEEVARYYEQEEGLGDVALFIRAQFGGTPTWVPMDIGEVLPTDDKAKQDAETEKRILTNLIETAPFKPCPRCGDRPKVTIRPDEINQVRQILRIQFPCRCLEHHPNESFRWGRYFMDTVEEYRKVLPEVFTLAIAWNTWPARPVVEFSALSHRVPPLVNAHRFTSGREAREAFDKLPHHIKSRYNGLCQTSAGDFITWLFDYCLL